MTVLVTGASGFLGRRLAELLVERGESVRVLVRQGSQLGALADHPLEVHRCSWTDQAALLQAMARVEIVYHCAGRSTDWGRWEDFRAANVEAVANLLRAAPAAGVRRFVHTSSTDVYGYPATPCDEAHELRDVGLPYNRSKCQGEQVIGELQHATGIPVTIVRPATIFGPRSKDWVAEVCRLLLAGRLMTAGGGRIVAGLVYVDDVADAMVRLAASETAAGEAYNVADPDSLTWRDYFDALAGTLGVAPIERQVSNRLVMPASWLCELASRLVRRRSRPLMTRHVAYVMTRSQGFPVDKLRRDIGRFPRIGMAEGLRRTTAWLHEEDWTRWVPHPA